MRTLLEDQQLDMDSWRVDIRGIVEDESLLEVLLVDEFWGNIEVAEDILAVHQHTIWLCPLIRPILAMN